MESAQAEAHLHFPVSFFSNEIQEELEDNLDAVTYNKILDIAKNGFECSWQDFWTYSLTCEKSEDNGFRNIHELRIYLTEIEAKYKKNFLVDSSGLIAKRESSRQRVLTEEVGVGGALALISHIYNLTQADWNIIPEIQNVKTLDFWREIPHITTNSRQIVEVEAKGTFISASNRERWRNNVKSHIDSIRSKKTFQRKLNPQNIFFGIVTAYSAQPDFPARCFICDPPARFRFNISSDKLRLLSRLNFYLDYLNLISRSNYLVALATRVSAITVLDNYFDLDSQSLKNRNGENFDIPDFYSATLTSFRYENMIGFGEVKPVNTGQVNEVAFFFFGMDLIIPRKLAEQNFSDINSYRCEFPPSFSISLEAKVRISELEVFRIDDSEFERVANSRRVILPLEGVLNCNSSGLIWGQLQLALRNQFS
jgi:hypothetical protein